MPRIVVKKIHLHPVPKKEELILFFNYLKNKPKYWTVFFMIAVCQGLRAREILNLTWDNFKYDYEKEKFTEMSYLTYKPKRYSTSTDVALMYKIVTMPIYSDILSKILKEYHDTVSCHYNSKRLFHFNNSGTPAKIFERIRKETLDKKEFDGFREIVTDTLFGGHKKKVYRIGTHSLRRFCMTFHYYNTFNQDIVKTSKSFGHSNVQTTYDHYIFPKESIGLDNKTNLDKFLFFEDINQVKITFYQDIIKKPFCKKFSFANQHNLLEY